MSQGDEQAESGNEQASINRSITSSEAQEHLSDAYDEAESVTEFHIVVEQDDQLHAVPSGGAIRAPPAIEMVYVTFTDAIEYQNYVVPMEVGIEPTSSGENAPTRRIQQFRQDGGSEFDVPWAVEATLEERADGWIRPTELKFEGLAKPVPLGQVIELGVEGGPDILEDIV
jgi:hypothetical protein